MKYKEIEEYIIGRIKDGTLSIGDQVETEAALSERFQASMPTVNKALTNLASQGYLTRIRGKGSFVNSKIDNDTMHGRRYYSFTEDIESIGKKPGSILIKYCVITAGEVPEVAKELNVAKTDKLHYFIRVRTADNEPIAVSYSYLPVKAVPYIDVSILDGGGSLWKFLAEQGFGGTKTSFYKIYAKMPTDEQAEWLKIDKTTPLLLSHHISMTKDKVIYNYVDTYYVSDRYEYRYISEIRKEDGEKATF